MTSRKLAAVLLALALAVGTRFVGRPMQTSTPAATTTESRPREAPNASATAPAAHGRRATHDPKKRDELRQKLLAAYAASVAEAAESEDRRGAGAPPATPARGNRTANDVEEFGRFVAQAIREDFVPLARACAKDLAGDFGERYPDGGTTTIAFELLGDSDIGGVVNEVETDEHRSTLRDPAFERCIRESLYGVYFDPPPAGGRATLRFDVVVDANREVEDQVDDLRPRDRRNER